MIDREAPRHRPPPSLRNDGTQRWTELLFAHYEVDEAALRAVVPPELELDPYEGRHFVGVVPFLMERIRAFWMPSFTAMSFHETNVRTYVRHRGRPGVYFLSLEASSPLAVTVARAQWGLPYFHARMTRARDGDVVHYTSARGAHPAELEVKYRVGAPVSAPPGSLEFYFLERYLLFSLRAGRVFVGQVHHVPYPAHAAELIALRESLVRAARLTIGDTPSHVHYSPGVDVEVFGPWREDREPAHLLALRRG